MVTAPPCASVTTSGEMGQLKPAPGSPAARRDQKCRSKYSVAARPKKPAMAMIKPGSMGFLSGKGQAADLYPQRRFLGPPRDPAGHWPLKPGPEKMRGRRLLDVYRKAPRTMTSAREAAAS
jgi:hypothetical protein